MSNIKLIKYLKSSIFTIQSSHRVQTGETQTVGFFKAAHDVHGVDRLTGCTLHQVVYGGDHHEPGAGKFETDVAVIGADENLGFRETINALFFFYNPDEGFLTVNPTVGLPDILFRCTFSDKKMGRHKNTPDHLNGGG